jgi:hypothetical protein
MNSDCRDAANAQRALCGFGADALYMHPPHAVNHLHAAFKSHGANMRTSQTMLVSMDGLSYF